MQRGGKALFLASYAGIIRIRFKGLHGDTRDLSRLASAPLLFI